MDIGNPIPGHFLQPATAPKPVAGRQLPPEEGVVFYSNTPGSTYIYTDGTIEIFGPGGNLVCDEEKIRQLRTAADRTAGLIHTREPVVEVMVTKNKLEEAREAIIKHAANQQAAVANPRIQALLDKAKAAALPPLATASQHVPPLGASTTTSIASGAKDSNSGTTTVKA